MHARFALLLALLLATVLSGEPARGAHPAAHHGRLASPLRLRGGKSLSAGSAGSGQAAGNDGAGARGVQVRVRGGVMAGKRTQ
jgi:hypothetical protein